MTKFKINKTIDEITTIVNGIQTLYMSQTTFSGLTSETAIKAGIVPNELINSDGISIHSPSANATIKILSDDKNFRIAFDYINRETCVNLATQNWGNSQSGLLSISIRKKNTGDTCETSVTAKEGCTEGFYKNVCYYACEGYLPITPAKAAYYCSLDKDDLYTFRLAYKK